jgi:hypothetical protein
VKRVAIAAALLASTLAPGAGEEAEFLHDSPPESWGSPARIVKPEYPPAALAQRLTGFVDFEGLVSEEGRLSEIEYRPETPQAEIFVAALKEVVPHWVFHPAKGTDCMPAARRAITRVWFELDGDTPRIKTTRRVEPSRKADPNPVWKTLKRVAPSYPRSLQRMQEQGLVYARVEVAPDGSVSAVQARVYPQERQLEPFAREVEKALKLWQYTPVPEGYTRPRVACMDVIFRLGS